MAINYFYPDYEVVRNPDRCVACRVCERQCANEVHHYDEDLKRMIADDSKCVNCHRCVSLCPTKASPEDRQIRQHLQGKRQLEQADHL